MSDPVREQYELYPYPPRDPREEASRLIEGSPSHVLEVNHYVFAGRRDFTRPFRALFAGGGTGDGTIMLAQQLQDRRCPAEIVYVDLSAAARAIAEARARARDLRNIRFLSGSLLELPTMGLGSFDYIDCCGVLHHLPDPAAGLAALRAVLSHEGGLGLMVYGAFGRTGVYQMQEALRLLSAAEAPAARLDVARRLLKHLPATNWLRRNSIVGDHLNAGDAGLYDLLLHSIDRAYTVPELVRTVEGAGLSIAALIEPWRYDPENFLADGALLKRIRAMDRWGRAALAELMTGNIKTHILYAVPAGRAAPAVARPDDMAMIPVLRDRPGATLAEGLKPGGALTVRADGIEAKLPLPRLAAPILAAIDGQRSIADIHSLLAAQDSRLDRAAFAAEFGALFQAFNAVNKLFLRREAGPQG
jgi:SAM-dependent methyltransferase